MSIPVTPQPPYPPYSISRSGTIPHGATILLTGSFVEKKGKPSYPTGTDAWQLPFTSAWPAEQIANAPGRGASPLAFSPSMGASELVELPYPDVPPAAPLNLDAPAPSWAFDKSLPVQFPDSNVTHFQRIVAHPNCPYSVRPDLRLRDAIEHQNISKYTCGLRRLWRTARRSCSFSTSKSSSLNSCLGRMGRPPAGRTFRSTRPARNRRASFQNASAYLLAQTGGSIDVHRHRALCSRAISRSSSRIGRIL